MPELRIAVRVIFPLLGLPVTLQTVAVLAEQLSDFGVADRMMPPGQLRRQSAGALAGPAKRRLRIAARRGLDQTVQRWSQTRIFDRQRVSPAALASNPARRHWGTLQFSTPLVTVTRDRPQARLTRETPPIAQFHRFAGSHQAAGMFIQMRPDASEVLSELRIGAHTNVIATRSSVVKVISLRRLSVP